MGPVVTSEIGDIVLAAGGTFTSKPRPVLIFQNTQFPTGDSVIVVPLTSQNNPSAYYRVAVTPTPGNGLDRNCWLEVDRVGAIRAGWIGPRIGQLDAAALQQVIDLSRRLMSPADSAV